MAAKRSRGRSPKKAGRVQPAQKGARRPKAPTPGQAEAARATDATGSLGRSAAGTGSDGHISQVLSLLHAQTKIDSGSYQEQTLIDRLERRLALTPGQTLADYVARLRVDPDEVRRLAGDLRAPGPRLVRDPEAADGGGNGDITPLVDVAGRNGAADAVARRLAAIVECSADAIFSKDLDGIIQTWNHGAERLYGYTPAEAIGRSVRMFIPADRAAELDGFMARLRAGETIEQVETERLSKDGRRVPVSLTLSPIRDGDGTVVAASAVVRDVSDRKRAEQVLRESERRAADDLANMLRLQRVSTQLVAAGEPTALLLEILDAAIATTVADMGNIQLMDPVSGTLKIVAERGFAGPFLEFFDAVHEGRAACGTALQGRTRVVVEDVTTSPMFVGTPALDVLRSAGVRAVQSTPLVSRSGRIMGMLSTHYRVPRRPADRDLRVIDLLARQAADWIERTRDEAALRESEQRFRLTADAAPVLIWTSGTDKLCTWFNKPWLDFVGRPMEQEVGMGWAENVHPDDYDHCLKTYVTAFDARRPFRMEYRLRRRDGEYRWLLDNGTPLPGGGGEFAGYIGSCIDITDRKRAEQGLGESEERFRRLAEGIRLIPWEADASTWEFTYVGPQAADILGYPPDQWYGDPRFWVERIHPDDRGWAVDFCAQRCARREPNFNFEYRMIAADGRTVWLHDIVNIVFDERGAGKLRGFLVDITERKAAEEALRENEQRLQLMADSLPVLISYVDAEGRCQFNNARYEEWFGLPCHAYKGRHLREVLGETAYTAIRGHVGAALAGQPRTFEGRLPYRTAGTRDVLVNYFPHRNPDGQIVGFYSIILDLTERKKAEHEVRANAERLRAILSTATDAIVTFDEHGIIQTLNPATEQMFGYGAEELVGRSVTGLLPSPYKDEHHHYPARGPGIGVRHLIGTGREVQARRKDGTVFPVDLAVSEVESPGLFTGIIRDITRRKDLEREVVEIASLEQRRIGQDLHDSVAQELTALNLLARDLTESLGTNRADAGELARLIARGLLTSQQALRAVMRGLLPVSVDSQGLMAALADLADRTRRPGKTACTFDCPEPVHVADNLTATHLYLIAQEAVHNAVKHALAGDIRIGLRSDGDLTLTVQDNGIGMPVRLTDSQGLGLRIMQNRAAIIGANLRYLRAQPHGTVVECLLPRSGHEAR